MLARPEEPAAALTLINYHDCRCRRQMTPRISRFGAFYVPFWHRSVPFWHSRTRGLRDNMVNAAPGGPEIAEALSPKNTSKRLQTATESY